MASPFRGRGPGGGHIDGGGARDDGIYRPVAETPAERRARIVRSEAARKRAVRKWTNVGMRPSPKLPPYAAYATGEASSSRRRPRSLTPPPCSDDEEDDADSGRVIGPKDFVKEPAEEEQALAEALAKKAAEEAERLATEEAERRAALRAIEEFKEREGRPRREVGGGCPCAPPSPAASTR
jgi:hypothetical protein